MIDTPFRIVQELVVSISSICLRPVINEYQAAGKAQDCFVANVLGNLEKSGERDTLNLETLRNCAGMGYIGGHLTPRSPSTILPFGFTSRTRHCLSLDFEGVPAD